MATTDELPADLPVLLGGEDVHMDIPAHRGWSDIRGWLVFDTMLPPALQIAEDATANADWERRNWRDSVNRVRPATDAEREMLTHLGFTVPADLDTVVTYRSGVIRRREWPALTDQQKDMA